MNMRQKQSSILCPSRAEVYTIVLDLRHCLNPDGSFQFETEIEMRIRFEEVQHYVNETDTVPATYKPE
jgi:hypothetical protein